MKRACRGRKAARPRQRNRARVQGPPPVRRVKGSMLTPAKFACLMVSEGLTAHLGGQISLKYRPVLQNGGQKCGPPRLVAAGPDDRSSKRGVAAPICPQERDQPLGSSTLSTTWITPFDWNTFW